MRLNLRSLLPGVALFAAACGEKPPENTEPTPADTVAMAMAEYTPAHFDTISWEVNDEAVVRGSVVFQYSCAKCHGTQGHGDGGFVTRGVTLTPPSFHAEDWRFRSDLDGLREQVFIGTIDGMPHWGLENLKYRDIDAVARFIQDRLVFEAPGVSGSD